MPILRQAVIFANQTVNRWSGGHPYETLSGRAFRRSVDGSLAWTVVVMWIDTLFFWQENHCQKAHFNFRRRHQPTLEDDFNGSTT